MIANVRSRGSELRRLLGTWRTRGEVVGDDGATIATIEGTDSYERLGEDVVVHRADVDMGDEHVQVFELIGPYDPGLDAYPTRAYDSRGHVEESTASVDDRGVWTFHADGAKATLKLGEDGLSMRAEWARQDDRDATWRPWMHLRFTRRGAGK